MEKEVHLEQHNNGQIQALYRNAVADTAEFFWRNEELT